MAGPKNTSKKGRAAGAMTKAERAERLRIVEQCIVEGRSSPSEIVARLAEEGRPDVAERTAAQYCREVRERRAAEDESARVIRKVVLLSEVNRIRRAMEDLLRKKKVKPRWRDLIELMKFQAELEEGGVPAPPGGAGGEEPPDLANKTTAELDAMLFEMMQRVDVTVPDEDGQTAEG